MSKIFRVFFSSTFKDFKEERNALQKIKRESDETDQKETFSDLKEFCATNGARFQPIDLRWGIPDEVGLQQSTMQICREEIKRCQNLTPRPNFVALLGERYGWTPPPVKIPKIEYDLISAHFSETDKALIKEWYKHDENELCKLENGTITSVYELQPRGEKFEDDKKWEPIEKKLRTILLQAALKAKLSEREMVKYYASVTHQEIVMGALEAHGADTHVHCFFRKLTGLPEGAISDDYRDSEPEKIKNLSNLKKQLKQRLPKSNIHEYEVDLGDKKDKENYLEKFRNDVYHSLETTILRELEDMEEISALDEEINAHIEFGKKRTKVFVGREDILNDIVDYVENDNRAPFVIYGEPGSGKSALMARAYKKLENQKKGDIEYILRFIGTTPSSSDSISLIRSICEQIITQYEIEFKEDIPFEYNKLKKTFRKLLGLIQRGKRAVILLDALDQLSKNDIGRDLTWLPQEFPKNVKLITSHATDDILITNTVEKKLPDSLHELKGLSLEEGAKALNTLLENALRRLTSDQEGLILQEFSEKGSPLYLKLAFEEGCTWNSYSNINSIKLAPDEEGLIQILFERLYTTHTRETVEKILSYIVAARNGLTEDEILGVMTSDSDYFNWYKNEHIHHILPEERLPWIVWSRLFSDLEPYLTMRGVDRTSTIGFFHRQFNEAIQKNLLSKIAEDRHQVLANYFHKANLYYQKNGAKTPNHRKLSELVYNLRKAKMWEKLENILTSLEFIEAKCSAVMTEDLLIDYQISLEDILVAKDISDNTKKKIGEFKHFVFNQAHILRKYPQLTIQQAINQPDISGSSLAGKDILKQTSFSKPLVEWKNKPQEQDPCILTFIGHSSWVNGCAISPDGTRVVSAPHDKILKLWDAETGVELRTFTGHSDSVTGCAFSPDGTRVLSASRDKTLKLWDAENGTELRTFRGHSFEVTGCAFSPDGMRVLSASEDKALKLWDAETGAELKIFTGHSRTVRGCAFSPDGTKVLSASEDKTLKLWDAETGAEIRTFRGHSDAVWGCAFSPDGTRVLSISFGVSVTSENALKLWDAKTGAEIRTLTGHTSAVLGCAFSPDGTRLLSASMDNTLKLWDAKTGAEIRTFSGHSDWVYGCAFSLDGTKILSASKDNTLKLWNAITDSKLRTFRGHSRTVTGCAFSPDGTRVVTASWDKTLKLWNAETGAGIKTFVGHSDAVSGCAFSPDGTRVVSASSDETLKLWDAETAAELRTFTGHSGWVDGCAFSPDGKRVLSASSDNTLGLWDTETGTKIRTFTGHSSDVYGCTFSPDGKRVVTASLDNTLRLWDVETGVEIGIFPEHSKEMNGCVFSPDGTRVLSASDEKTLRLWDAETGVELRTFRGHSDTVGGCAFSPDGKRVLSASHDKTLKLWDAENGTELRTFSGHSREVHRCTFSPGGTRVLSASEDNTLKLWDAETGTELRTFRGHSDTVCGCAFSPDGTRVLSASHDKTLKLWDAETGAELRTFIEYAGRVNGCAFSPDGTKILSASEDNTLKLWDAKTGVELRTFRGHHEAVLDCAFSPDGTRVLAASEDNMLHIWDVEKDTWINVFIGHSAKVNGCAFSPDGMRVVSASSDHTLMLWDVETTTMIRSFPGHSGNVYGCAFSPDGTKVLSASGDKSLKLWDTKNCTELKTFTGHTAGVNDCAFLPDGTKILSASEDNTLKLWDAETGGVVILFPALGQLNSIALGVNNLVAAGDNIGMVYILQLSNIPLRSAIVTPVKLYNFKTKSYSKEFSINCKWCGVHFPLDDEMVWSKSEDHPEGRLGEVIECPTCHKSLELNSFVVGKRT